MTYTEFNKNNDFDKLNNIIIENLNSLESIIDYNIKNNIHFYRLTSKLIPLATKDDVQFEYIDKYKNLYDKVSQKIKNSNMRVDFHPDQFCVLNSTKKEIVENSINILKESETINSFEVLKKSIGNNILLVIILLHCLCSGELDAGRSPWTYKSSCW